MREKRGDSRFINYNRITLELAPRGAVAGAGAGAAAGAGEGAAQGEGV